MMMKGIFLQSLSLLLLLSLSHTTTAQSYWGDTPSPTPDLFVTVPDDCSAESGSCLDCVSAGCAWAIGGCQDSCDGFPLDCYSRQTTVLPPGTYISAQAICDLQQQQAQDAAFCGIQQSCEACTSTQLKASVQTRYGSSEPVTTCSWYDERGTCSHLVQDEHGKSSPFCRDTSEGQCYYNAQGSCEICLQLGGGVCTWTGHGTCERTCKQGQECFNQVEYPGQSTPAICNQAESYQADLELCQEQDSCSACTGTRLADGSNCQWFENNVTLKGMCDLPGDFGDGGQDTCAGGSVNYEYEQCQALATLSPDDITCTACLQANCAWQPSTAETGQCIPTCSIIQDDAHCVEPSPADTITNICNDAATEAADEAICSTIYNCQACTAQLKSDRRSNCQWYSNYDGSVGYCGTGSSGCDSQSACPSSTCDGSSYSASSSSSSACRYSSNSCSQCLTSTTESCVWDGSTCLGTCNEVSFDRTCYSNTNPDFTGASSFFICDTADNDAANGNRDIVDPNEGSGAESSMTRVTAFVLVVATTAMTVMVVV